VAISTGSHGCSSSVHTLIYCRNLRVIKMCSAVLLGEHVDGLFYTVSSAFCFQPTRCGGRLSVTRFQTSSRSVLVTLLPVLPCLIS
jgi:hypothetical protein